MASRDEEVGVPSGRPTLAKGRRLGGRRPSLFWRIREDIPRPLHLSLVTASLVIPLVAWTIIAAAGVVSPIFLPSPLAVAQAGEQLISSGQLGTDAWASIRRVGLGFGLAILVSIPLGLAMGTFKSMNALFEPIIGFVRYMPAPAFLSLMVIWLGLGEQPKIALIFVGTVFFNTLMTANLVWQVPSEMIRVAFTLGAGNATVFRKVIFPYALPGIIDAARVNLAAAWALIIVAELLAADEGLGVRITRAQRFLNTDQIFFILIVIGVIGLTCDILLRIMRNRVAPWSQE